MYSTTEIDTVLSVVLSNEEGKCCVREYVLCVTAGVRECVLCVTAGVRECILCYCRWLCSGVCHCVDILDVSTAP